MSTVEPKNVAEILEPEKSLIDETLITGKNGIVVIPELFGDVDQPIVKADTGDFIKWLKITSPEVEIFNSVSMPKLVLNSGDYWLPLVFLASDITLPIYLNLVASYLYDKAKGALIGDTTRVHFSAVYEDKKEGKKKQFNFEGDVESLQKTIKRFDLNKFLDE